MRFSKKYFIVSVLVVLFLVGAELFSRFYWGLGTPPLLMTHPTIEYLYQPNQDIQRFRNRILINQYGMRSAPFQPKKEPDELRVIVFGDSVVNGGNSTDHNALATTILQEQLNQVSQHKKVVVGNISAGSWGPGNWLAYLREYGDFDADVIALVISSHDYFDNPKFEPLDGYFYPQRRPVSAVVEGVTRYVPQVLGWRSPPKLDPSDTAKAKGLSDLKDFLQLAKRSGATVIVFQHLGKAEMVRKQPYLGYPRVRELCKSLNIPTVSLRPYFQQAIEQGQSPYQDDIHPSDSGHRLIAQAMLEGLQTIDCSSGLTAFCEQKVR